MSSTCALVMISGGQKAIESPMAREITPFCCSRPLTSPPSAPTWPHGALVALSATSLDRRDETDAAHFADQLVRSQFAQALLHVGADLAGVVDQVALLDDA